MSFPFLGRRTFLAASLLGLGAGLLGLAPHGAPRALAAEEGPIRIGLLAPLTGTGGPYGKEEEVAARAAVDHINAAGGVLGRKLELFVADDESTPTAGVAAARKLIDVNKVSAIAGVWSSAVALAVRPLAIEKGVALLPNGSADELTAGIRRALSGVSRPMARSGGAPSPMRR